MLAGSGFTVVVLIAVSASFAAYGSISYSSRFQMALQFVGPSLQATVWAYLSSDGPFSAAHVVNVDEVTVTGYPSLNATGAQLEIYVPDFPAPQTWISLNSSVTQRSDGGWYLLGLALPPVKPQREGVVNFTGTLRLWEGGKEVAWVIAPQFSGARLLVEPAQAWSQYNSLRITTSVAVLTLVLVGLPSGIRGMRDLFWPPIAEWLRHRPRG